MADDRPAANEDLEAFIRQFTRPVLIEYLLEATLSMNQRRIAEARKIGEELGRIGWQLGC